MLVYRTCFFHKSSAYTHTYTYKHTLQLGSMMESLALALQSCLKCEYDFVFMYSLPTVFFQITNCLANWFSSLVSLCFYPRLRLVVNSASHPHAYAFLNRLCGKGAEEKGVPQEIIDQWRGKGPGKNQLLHMFVTKCYLRDDDSHGNRGRLEALVRFKQVSKEFRQSLQGFSWLTKSDMQKLGWNESKVDGAIEYCTSKKLTKDCLYEKNTKKYLVQVTDDVKKLWHIFGAHFFCFVVWETVGWELYCWIVGIRELH